MRRKFPRLLDIFRIDFYFLLATFIDKCLCIFAMITAFFGINIFILGVFLFENEEKRERDVIHIPFLFVSHIHKSLSWRWKKT